MIFKNLPQCQFYRCTNDLLLNRFQVHFGHSTYLNVIFEKKKILTHWIANRAAKAIPKFQSSTYTEYHTINWAEKYHKHTFDKP